MLKTLEMAEFDELAFSERIKAIGDLLAGFQLNVLGVISH